MSRRSDGADVSRRTALILVVASTVVLVAGVRLCAHRERTDSPLSSWHRWSETDEWAAVAAAKRIAAGNVLDRPAFRPYFTWQRRFGSEAEWNAVLPANVAYQGPAYPYLLALAGAPAGGALEAVRLAQLLLAVVAAGSVAAAGFAVVLRSGRTPALAVGVGALAGLLHGTYGPLVFLDGFLYRDGPVAHLSALLLALPLIPQRPPRARLTAFVGLLAGVSALLKQTLLPLGLVAGGVLALRAEGRRAVTRAAAAFAAGLLCALGPLVARNVAVGASPLAFDTRPLVGIPWANAKGADGSVDASPLLMDVLREAHGSTLRAGILTLETWRDDPAGFVLLLGRKLGSALNGTEVADNASFFFFRDRLPWLARMPLFTWVVGAGVTGLLLAGRRRLFRGGEGLLVTVSALAPLAACLMVSTTTRYRSGASAPLALGTALLALYLFEAFRERRPLRLLPWAGLAAALTIVALLPSPVRAWPWRWADTIVAATLAEERLSPEAGAAEVRRYLAENRGDPDRARGLVAMHQWLAGRREHARVEPSGIAPPSRRVSAAAR